MSAAVPPPPTAGGDPVSTGVVEQISDLLRDRPPLGAPADERAAWLARKVDVLDAIATEAAATPGLVDPLEARRVADGARAQVSAMADRSSV